MRSFVLLGLTDFGLKLWYRVREMALGSRVLVFSSRGPEFGS